MKPVDYDVYAIVIYGILSCDASSMLNLMLSKGISIKDVDPKGMVNVTVEIPDDILTNKIDDINKEFESANLESVRKCGVTKISGNKGRMAIITVPSEIYLAIRANSMSSEDSIEDIMENSGPYTRRVIEGICNNEMVRKLKTFRSVRYEIAVKDNVTEEWCNNANAEMSMSFYKCIRNTRVVMSDVGNFYNVHISIALSDKILEYNKKSNYDKKRIENK